MNTKELTQNIVDMGKKEGAQDIEVYYQSQKSMEVVIEKNDIQVPKADLYEGVGIRVLTDKRLGFASTNVLTESSIKEAIQSALNLARSSPPDPYNSLPEPRELKEVQGTYDEEGAQQSLQDLIAESRSIMEETSWSDERVRIDSANLKTDVLVRAIASSRGVLAQEKKTQFENMLMGFARDGDEISSFDIEYKVDCHARRLQPIENARRLKEKVLNSLGARSVPSFKGSILLSPFSAANLVVMPLVFSVNADNVQNGLSPWREKMGSKVGADILNVMDNGQLDGAVGSKMFDREGQPPESMEIVKDGILQGFFHNHYTASREGISSNGHAGGNDQSVPSIGAHNFILQPGEDDLETMMSTMSRGLLVTRYSGSADPISGDFSGVVKGGHLIEQGKKVHPVKEVMIAGNIYELLQQIVAFSKDVQTIMSYQIPYVQLDGISITGS